MSCMLTLVLFLTAWPITADGAKAKSNDSVKPWELSVQERLRKRFDPVSIRERKTVEATEPFGYKRESASRSTRNADDADEKLNVVLGRRNPELLMPWELFNDLKHAYSRDPIMRETLREVWEKRSADIDLPSDFWQELEIAAADYIQGSSEEIDLFGELNRTSNPVDQDQIRRKLLALGLCAKRAAALERARATFGREKFDRFLYTAIAPDLSVTDSDFTPEQHLRAERGCR